MKGDFLPSDLKKMDINQLDNLAAEIRKMLLENIPVTGGHLAPNLGVVELTIALHYVLDIPRDKIVWDVGHQTYVHKILTGRGDKIGTIRKRDGISGFPKPHESEYDSFGTGHSSTSISAALGMAAARDLNGEDYKIAAVIGDGSLTGGLAFEGLNNCGIHKTPILIILNDNQMSISHNVGALDHYFSKLRSSRSYWITKVAVKKHLSKIPIIGRPLVRFAEHLKAILKAIFVPNVLFEELGITYIGSVDGHNIKKMITIFDQAKDMNVPVLVHVRTRKGKGCDIAEQHPDKFHSISANCDVMSVYEPHVNDSTQPASNSVLFGSILCQLAESNPNIVAITAAMKDGTGLAAFAEKYPQRFFDVGIAEQHAVTFAAGLAIQGKRPVAAIYSSFLQRAYDSILHDVCIQNLPVLFCIDRAGIVGEDGETHQGVFDISYLLPMPNMTVFAPSCEEELRKTMEWGISHCGPVAIRYGKCCAEEHHFICEELFQWKASLQPSQADAVIFACGDMVAQALQAAELLKKEKIEVSVVNMLCLKPLCNSVLDSFAEIKHWFVAENGVAIGGVGSEIAQYAAENSFRVQITSIAVPDVFVHQGSIPELLEELGMDAKGIANTVLKVVKNGK